MFSGLIIFLVFFIGAQFAGLPLKNRIMKKRKLINHILTLILKIYQLTRNTLMSKWLTGLNLK